MSEASANNKSGSARWTDDLRAQYILVLVEKTNQGVYTDNGFKSQDWKWITSEFNDRTHAGFEKSQLQSQYAELKKKFGIVSDLKSNSGFGWDYEKELPTAPDDVWQRYIAAHPKAAPFRYTSLRNYDELDIVFSGKCATGDDDSSTPSGKRQKVKRECTKNKALVMLEKLSSKGFEKAFGAP